MCYLSSLSEVSVLECKIPEDMLSGIQQLDTESAIKMTITQEVGRLAMGASHIVTAVNNKIQGHAIVESGGTMPLFEREMRGHVVDLKMNRTHYAALIDGSVHVIPIDADPNGETQPMVLPTTTTFKVTTMCMSGEFVIVGSQQGHVQHYVMDETTPATEFRHELGICELAANQRGTRVVFVDTEMKGWMWNPIDDQCELIPGFPGIVAEVHVDGKV